MAGPDGTVYPEQEIEIDNNKAIELINGGYAVELENLDKTQLIKKSKIYPKHIAGGLYLLPNGEKVKGKEAALEALMALEGGNNNGTQTDNGTDT